MTSDPSSPGAVVEVLLPGGHEVRGVLLEPEWLELGPAGFLIDVGAQLFVQGHSVRVVGSRRAPRRAQTGEWQASPHGIQLEISWDEVEEVTRDAAAGS